jgi:hypothetical protein
MGSNPVIFISAHPFVKMNPSSKFKKEGEKRDSQELDNHYKLS